MSNFYSIIHLIYSANCNLIKSLKKFGQKLFFPVLALLNTSANKHLLQNAIGQQQIDNIGTCKLAHFTIYNCKFDSKNVLA